MNRRVISILAAIAVVGVIPVVAAQGTATAVPAQDDGTQKHARSDDKPDTLNLKRRTLKEQAATDVAKGTATLQSKNGSKVVDLGRGKKHRWVEYEPTEKAQLLTFLVDFGDGTGNPAYPDNTSGPVHNTIPKPAADDNSTYWESDFSPEHFKEMFFTGLKDQNGESFHNVYKEMSSGRFDLQGDVSDWIKVAHPESYYQDSKGGESATAMRNYIQDSANAWYDAEKAKGMTDQQITDYLKQFDQWDRYDLDGDGNFNEPDGYIDHFQAIHAGTGEEAGAPPWTIWSHRWAANPNGPPGPADYPHAGGVKIGNTDFWIRDYTTEPENGGLGVFSHEFGHDLGLPDYYDTAGGDNGTGFWNLMSSGSWMNHGQDNIGTTPDHMGATEKLFLGWLNFATVKPGQSKKVTLGPSYHDTGNATPQAVVASLPDGKKTVDVGSGSSGKSFLYSGTGDNLTATAVSPKITVPDGGQLTAKVKYDLEKDYDYTFVEVSTDGSTWTTIPTNRSGDASVNYGIDGSSDPACSPNCATGTDPQVYADLSADLSAYAGKSVQIRFRTVTDGGTHYYGFAVDDLAVGSAYSTDFSSFDGWTTNKYYEISDGSYSFTYPRMYVAENRQYLGYDVTLKQGPYNFGWLSTHPGQVEHFPYQDGLLVWFKNGLYSDNNTSAHPGGGQALPVDAHATALKWASGSNASGRINTYDSTFGLDRTDPLSLHKDLSATTATTLVLAAQRAVSVFDDSDPNAYYDPAIPGLSTKVAGSGTTMKVLKQNRGHHTLTVQVTVPAS